MREKANVLSEAKFVWLGERGRDGRPRLGRRERTKLVDDEMLGVKSRAWDGWQITECKRRTKEGRHRGGKRNVDAVRQSKTPIQAREA